MKARIGGAAMTVGPRGHDGGERRHETREAISAAIIGIPIVGYLSGEHLWAHGIRPWRGIFQPHAPIAWLWIEGRGSRSMRTRITRPAG